MLAAGLVQLHDGRHRGKTIITCLFDSWKVLKERGGEAFWHRFDEPLAMEGMNDQSAVRTLILNRLSPAYQAAKFHATIPILAVQRWGNRKRRLRGNDATHYTDALRCVSPRLPGKRRSRNLQQPYWREGNARSPSS